MRFSLFNRHTAADTAEADAIMQANAEAERFYARLDRQTARQRAERERAGAAINANIRAWQAAQDADRADARRTQDFTRSPFDGRHGVGQ